MKKIKILDTTLRDGEQSPGCSMNAADKLKLALQLEKIGVDIIEAGFPYASKEEFRAVSSIANALTTTQVCCMARAKREDIDAAVDAMKGAANPRLNTFISVSDIHMTHKLNMTREQTLARVRESVSYAKDKIDDIQFGAEDATRSEPEFLAEVYSTAIEAGATVIIISDTVGYATLSETTSLLNYLKQHVRGVNKVEIGIHCHNDLGLATANSFAAVLNGATQIECTISGIGERAGNTSLEEVVMGLTTRSAFYQVKCNIDTVQLYPTAKMLSEIIGLPIPRNKPIIGDNIFSHESGIHQDGMLKNPLTYEIMTPESVGREKTKYVLGKHSGRRALQERIEGLGIRLDEDRLTDYFWRFKDMADSKKEITDNDLIALAR